MAFYLLGIQWFEIFRGNGHGVRASNDCRQAGEVGSESWSSLRMQCLAGWLRGLEICPVVFVSCLPSVRSHIVARYFDLRRICESSFCLLFLRCKSLQRFQRFDEFEFSCSTVCCGVCALAIR